MHPSLNLPPPPNNQPQVILPKTTMPMFQCLPRHVSSELCNSQASKSCDYQEELGGELAWDIYMNLRVAENMKRPCPDFMKTVQSDMTSSARSEIVDWLVEVTEYFNLGPEVLHLSVNCMDRYLSSVDADPRSLGLLAQACFLIATKYEGRRGNTPLVEEFCGPGEKEEVLQMEVDVLKCLKFDLATPTAKTFLTRFVWVARQCDRVPLPQLEFLADYIAELSLLQGGLMLVYPPSLIAAAAVFLAKFMLLPTKHPWTATLAYCTNYEPDELRECVNRLHVLVRSSAESQFPTVREKYCKPEYKSVAENVCFLMIPSEFFERPC